MTDLSEIIGSKARAEIFRILFDRKDVELHLRELQRQTGLAIGSVQQELRRLSKLDLVKTRKDGNRLYYSANDAHPLFPHVRGLVEKTVGVAAILTRALSVPEVRVAFIFGSVATGRTRAESDVDLFIIGDLGLRKATKLLSGIAMKVGREINPHVFSPEEFSRRVQSKDHFVSRVLETKRTFLIGGEDELRALGRK